MACLAGERRDRTSRPAPGTREGSSEIPRFGGSSNGRTADSDSAYLGSNPSPPANTPRAPNGVRGVWVGREGKSDLFDAFARTTESGLRSRIAAELTPMGRRPEEICAYPGPQPPAQAARAGPLLFWRLIRHSACVSSSQDQRDAGHMAVAGRGKSAGNQSRRNGRPGARAGGLDAARVRPRRGAPANPMLQGEARRPSAITPTQRARRHRLQLAVPATRQ